MIMDDCLFCKIVSGDLPGQKIYENVRVVAFLDIHPVNPGHTLVVPKAHADNYLSTPEEDLAAMSAVVKKIAPAIIKAVGADACNIQVNNGRAAGQVVFHTHQHIIPRFTTDDLRNWPGTDEHQDFEAIGKKIREEIGV